MAKLPFLFHHYAETSGGDGFLKFMTDHYSDSRHQNEDHEHGKLPFKHSEDGCTHHPAFSIIKEVKSEDQFNLISFSSPDHSYAITDEINFPVYYGNIWQPPKLFI